MGCIKHTAAVVLAMAISLGVGFSPFRGLVQLVDFQARARDGKEIEVESLRGRKVVLRRHPGSGVIQSEADTEPDMIFGQGYALAMDRLFQIEVLRRLARGELAEMVGEKAVPIDKWHRSMNFTALGMQDYVHLREFEPKMAECLDAFAVGINTYLKGKTLVDMPVDLMVLGVVPEPIEPWESISFTRWHSAAMNKGWQNELLYTKLFSEIPSNVVEAIRVGVAYDVDGVGGGMGSTFEKVNEWNVRPPSVHPLAAGLGDAGGSNGWVISGEFTKSGKPLLANDPHLPFALPAMWHDVRLTCKPCGIDTVGMAVPFVPYLISGHNNFSAYGVTLNRCDGDDIFLEKIHANGSYLDSDGEYKPLVNRTEYIKVKGQSEPIKFEVATTRRGPLVCHLLGIEHDCSLSSLASQSSEVYRDHFNKSNIHCLRELMLARDMKHFRYAGEMMSYAMLNMIYANEAGDIGYTMTGRVAKRKDIGEQAREGWNPEHQHDGWLPFEEMPHSLNPKKGFIISANQKPYKTGEGPDLGRTWQHGWRAKRIEELIKDAISRGEKIDSEMSREWQRDLISIPGRTFASHVVQNMTALKNHGLVKSHPALKTCLTLLAKWNGSMDVDSPQAAIYTVTKESTLRVALRKFIKSEATVDEVMGVGFIAAGKSSNDLEGKQAAFFLKVIERAEGIDPLLDGRAAHDVLLEGMLEGVEMMVNATGKRDPATWRWGEVHTARYTHPLGKVQPLDHLFNIEIGEVPGDVDTVNLAAVLHQRVPHPGLPLPSPIYLQRGFAASSRFIVDMADTQNVYIAIAPGNSGRPSSAHFANMAHILTVPNDEGVVPLSMTEEGTAAQPTEVVFKKK